MIRQVGHGSADTGPASLTLALAVARELHAPHETSPPVRAPEIAARTRPRTRRGRRTAAPPARAA
jgi:hypothetical protein